MKIAYFVNKLDRGGAEKQLFLIMKHLKSRHEFLIIALSGEGDLKEEFMALGVPLFSFNIDRSLINPKSILSIFQIRSILKSAKPAIVHSWLFRPNLIASVSKHFLNKPALIISERGTSFWFKKRRFILYNIIYKMSDIIMVNTNALKSDIINYFGVKKKIRIIQNGINLDIDHDKVTINPLVKSLREKNNIIIGCIGRFVKLKRYEDILDAAKMLLQVKKKIHFVLVGGRGNIEYYKKLAKQYSIQKYVTFTGEVNDVFPYLKGFDIFLHASSTEGLPNVIMEAMLMGKPIITTNVGGTPDLIEDGVNGLLIPPFRPDKIVEAIKVLLTDPELQKKMSINNMNRIKDFSIEQMVAKVNQMYAEVVSR